MGSSLLIERTVDGVFAPISLDEWKRLVAVDPDLRLRTEPRLAVNPRTGDRIIIPVGEADSEFFSGGEWLPFVWFSHGRLEIGYQDEFSDPTNQERLKIGEIARDL